MRLSWLLLFFAMSSSAAPASLTRGRITLAGDGVPGVTVTLGSATCFTDEHGRYTFENVPTGLRVVKAELAGVGITELVIEVKDGDNAIADVALPWVVEEITMSCRPCRQDPPETEWDDPTCAEYELDESLIESAGRGDASAIELLETRYAHARTWTERFLIAGGLLGRSKDDRELWSEVARHAEIAVRYFDGAEESREKFKAYCEERGYPVEEYDTVVWSAFHVAMSDKRSRPLLLRALESRDEMMVYGAILGLASQKDESALPAIEKALRRFDDPEHLAIALREYASPAADAVALQFAERD